MGKRTNPVRVIGCLAMLFTCERGAVFTTRSAVVLRVVLDAGASTELPNVFVVFPDCVEVPFAIMTLYWGTVACVPYGFMPGTGQGDDPEP